MGGHRNEGGGGVDARVGFFGKVTSHGDFVARRLALDFQHGWDAWLQDGLRHSRAALGRGWLATYLSSPIWRFALAPGVCGALGRAGLLMPSVDRVGRHFPLTLARALDPATSLPDCATAHGAWYERLEMLALSSLGEQFSLDEFDAALKAVEPPPIVAAGAAAMASMASNPGVAGTVISLDTAQPLERQLASARDTRLMQAIAGAALSGQSLWWTDGSPQVAPCLLASHGLPPPTVFAALLDGDWRRHGWPGA